MEFYLISYDIPNTKRRTKIANLLLEYGGRVQLSVFEVWLDTRTKKQLFERLQKQVNADEDNIRIYQFCKICKDKVDVIGNGTPPQAPDAIII